MLYIEVVLCLAVISLDWDWWLDKWDFKRAAVHM